MENTNNVIVQFPTGETLNFNIDSESNINMLKSSVCNNNIKFNELALIFNGRKLDGKCSLAQAGITNNSTVQAVIGVEGGSQSFMDPLITELARKFRVEKKICRACYCNLSVKAKKCRKRRCGHNPDIRARKALADKGTG